MQKIVFMLTHNGMGVNRKSHFDNQTICLAGFLYSTYGSKTAGIYLAGEMYKNVWVMTGYCVPASPADKQGSPLWDIMDC